MTGVRVIRSIREIDPQAWAQLAKACDASVFYSWEFLTAVEAQPLTARAQPFYLVAEDSFGDLLAVLPMYLQETRDPFATVTESAPAMRILASHLWHCYDTTVPCRAALDPWLLERLWTAVRRLAEDLSADMYGLVNVPRQGPLGTGLEAIGLTAQATAPRYRVDLRGPHHVAEDHLARVGRASRKTLRAYVRRAARAGAAVTADVGVRQLDEDLLELCHATADKHAPGYYPRAPLAALIAALGANCRIIRIDLDGQLLAASICLYDEMRMHAWAGGCRYPEDLNWSPQYVLFWAELTAAFGSGRPGLECGRRNDEFKRRYGLAPVELARVVERR
jgi:predicted N-acyltransferase